MYICIERCTGSLTAYGAHKSVQPSSRNTHIFHQVISSDSCTRQGATSGRSSDINPLTSRQFPLICVFKRARFWQFRHQSVDFGSLRFSGLALYS